MSPEFEVLLLAIIVVTACVLPGVFLVLRGVSLMSDAISHAILLGIVLSFFIVQDLNSPWLIIAATLTGILTVTLTELIISTKRMKKDAAIGIVFPVFFSIGVILISQFASDIHLDTDAVLLGEIAFAPFNRWVVSGLDLGPKAIWLMGIVALVNSMVVTLFYKELKIATFDPGLAHTLGFSPLIIHYGLMTMTSLTAVGAFDSVGSILVVALMIAPPSAAYLLTKRVSSMIGLSIIIGWISATIGYGLAIWGDVSIAGSMASVSGGVFIVVLLIAPEQGLLSKLILHNENKLIFSSSLLLVQLLSHEKTVYEAQENTVSNMVQHMGWSVSFAEKVARFGVQKQLIIRQGDMLSLTNLGRESAKATMVSN